MKKNLRQYFDDMTNEEPFALQDARTKNLKNDRGEPLNDIELQKSLQIPPKEMRRSNRDWFEKLMGEIKQSQVLAQQDIEQ